MRKSFICSLLLTFSLSNLTHFLILIAQYSVQTWFPKDATTNIAMTGSPSSPKHNSLSSLRSMLFLNSVSQSTHEITKLVPQARMLWVLTFLSIKNTSKSPWALILCGSELSFKGPIMDLFNLVYLWLHRLLSKRLSFLFCLYPFYQPPISSNLPSIFLKYISDHAACLL